MSKRPLIVVKLNFVMAALYCKWVTIIYMARFCNFEIVRFSLLFVLLEQVECEMFRAWIS